MDARHGRARRPCLLRLSVSGNAAAELQVVAADFRHREFLAARFDAGDS